MGLREAVLIAWVGGLGVVAVAAADPRPAKVEAESTAKAADSKHGSKAPAPKAQGAKAADAKVEDAKPAAGDPAAEAADAPAEESAEAAEATMPPHVVGPKLVALGNNTEIDLPEGMILFERTEAQKLLRDMGNSPENTVAIVVKLGSDWLIDIDYDDSGYIDDSDAADLDAGELLESYREGTRQQNARRKSLGKPEMVIDDWSERPRYERAQRHLVWGIAGHDVESKVVNFFTRILGRNGYLSVNLIAAPEQMEASKKEALAVLQATRFKAGARYEDHTSSDRSSGIGLRGLVLGGAGVAVASKLGFLAKILLVLKKGVIVVFAAIGGLFRWLFRRKPQESLVSDGSGDPLQGAGGPPPGGPDDTGAAG